MSIRFFHQTMRILVSTNDTDGRLSAVEVAGPRGAVPPIHVHHREDEAFFILQGEYSIFIGDDVIMARPGTWLWGPRDVPHGYQIHSDSGRHLSLITPAGFEAFFEEVTAIATPDADPRNELPRISAIADRYGVELLRPAPRPSHPQPHGPPRRDADTAQDCRTNEGEITDPLEA
jgi:quercetin dioxygenase-like cupin family protein